MTTKFVLICNRRIYICILPWLVTHCRLLQWWHLQMQYSPLYLVCERGDDAAIKLLLQRADISVNLRNEVRVRAQPSCLILSNWLSVHISDFCLIEGSCCVGCWITPQKLNTALMVAANHGRLSAVQMLLAKPDIQINLQNEVCYKHLVCWSGLFVVVGMTVVKDISPISCCWYTCSFYCGVTNWIDVGSFRQERLRWCLRRWTTTSRSCA